MEYKMQFGQPLPWRYFLRAYGMSFLLTGMFLTVFYFTGDLRENIGLFLLFGILFPFAQIPFDLLIGFKLMKKIAYSKSLHFFDYKFQFFFSLILYIMAVFLAPLGMIYQVTALIYRTFRKKHS